MKILSFILLFVFIFTTNTYAWNQQMCSSYCKYDSKIQSQSVKTLLKIHEKTKQYQQPNGLKDIVLAYENPIRFIEKYKGKLFQVYVDAYKINIINDGFTIYGKFYVSNDCFMEFDTEKEQNICNTTDKGIKAFFIGQFTNKYDKSYLEYKKRSANKTLVITGVLEENIGIVFINCKLTPSECVE